MKNQTYTPHALDLGGIKLKVHKIDGTPVMKKNAVSSAPMRIHTHFTYEVFFVTEGTLDLTLEEDLIVFEQGIFIVPPYVSHCSSPMSDGSYCLLFSFYPSEEADRIRQQLDRGVTRLPITEEVSFYIRALAAKSRSNDPKTRRDTEFLTALIFNAILTELMPGSKAQPSPAAPHDHISAIESFINSDLRRKLTLSDVAAHVFLSTKQVSRIIEKGYGMGFSELVTKKRMASAEAMLIDTDLKISQIAAELFPDTPTYFYTLFKKKHGMSPLNYRKAHALSRKA